MTTRMMTQAKCYAAAMLGLALAVSCPALAREGGHGVFVGHATASHLHFDSRFSHNHVYFDRGFRPLRRPRYGYPVFNRRDQYWYDKGQWYHRGGFGWRGFDWVVAAAPVGAFVSTLPPFYTTVWFDGVPYYYANDTYYDWIGDRQQYEVVEPPASIESAGTTQAPPSHVIYVYPKNGQSSQQQGSDRYQCDHSAVQQTGYDPTQAGGGVPADMASVRRGDYFRVSIACLEARGYSVR